jgi:RNA polymerase sigma factor (sigma-70 family)
MNRRAAEAAPEDGALGSRSHDIRPRRMAVMQQPVPLTESPVARPVTARATLVRGSKAGTSNRIVPERTLSREHWEQLFLAQLPTIQRVVSSVARQQRLSPADAEDFAADVHLRLISDDYAVLRKFRSGCNLRTFLTVVIRRLCLDYRNAQWGKWRPSARSVREGEVAVRLEQLTVRDGFTFDEACDILETNDRRHVDRTALSRTYGRFRQRARPRFVSDDTAGDQTPAPASADEAVIAADAQGVVDRTASVLRGALRATSRRDRLILKLHFFDGLSIADTGRRLGLDQKRLYRRLEWLLNRLHATLERKGVCAAEALAAASRPETSFGTVFPPDDLVAMLRAAVQGTTLLLQ